MRTESSRNPAAPYPTLALARKDAKQDLAAKAAIIRPSEDQIYLAGRLNQHWDTESLTPAAVCKLNKRYGLENVSNALRLVRGFPPAAPTSSPYAYLVAVLEGDK